MTVDRDVDGLDATPRASLRDRYNAVWLATRLPGRRKETDKDDVRRPG